MEPAKNAVIFTPTENTDFRYTVTPGTPVDCFFAGENSSFAKHAVFPGEYCMFSLFQRAQTFQSNAWMSGGSPPGILRVESE